MNFKALLALFLMFISIITGCKKDANSEKEPNNSYKKATRVDPLLPVKGFISDKKDIDWYICSFNESASMTISLSAVKGVNHAFKIYSKTGGKPELLKFIDDYRKSSPEQIKNFSFDPGEYYIQVFHGDRDKSKGNKEMAYTLQMVKNSIENIEAEPNDTVNQATKINTGDEIIGFFSPSFNKNNKAKDSIIREEDWFYFESEATEESPLTASISLSGVAGINSILYLYDSEMKKIAQSDMGHTSKGEELKSIGIKNPGKYYIVLASKSYEVNMDRSYRLKFNLEAYDSSRELEPNNSIEKSNGVIDKKISGKIFPESDRDIFKIPAEEDGAVLHNFTLTSEKSGNMKITLYDSNKNRIGTYDNGELNQEEVISGIYTDSHLYLEITSSGKSENDGGYELSYSSIPYENEFEKEPNGLKSNPTIITGDIIRGFTTSKGDVDYFKLDYGKNIQKKISVQLPENCEIEISITDQLGYIVSTREVKTNEPFVFQEMIEKGSFLIVKTKVANLKESYSIKLEE